MEKIKTENLDPAFKYEVAGKAGAENLKKCFACGTCTAGCPVFQVESGYNPRKIIRMVLLGMREEVLSSKMIWLCARCYACTATCPQGVNFADIMVVLRDMAIQAGQAQPDILEKIENISQAAHAFRRDCINMVTGIGQMTKDKIKTGIVESIDRL